MTPAPATVMERVGQLCLSGHLGRAASLLPEPGVSYILSISPPSGLQHPTSTSQRAANLTPF